MRKFLKSALLFFWEISKIVIIALLIVVPIRYFVFQPFFVRGQSMEPNFYNSDYLIIDEISYYFTEPARGEVVVFKYPNDPSQRYIKRIVGLPGETVEIQNNEIIISAENQRYVLNETNYLSSFSATPGSIRISLSDEEYFVLGDNRSFSSDSRRWGAVSREEIIGRVLLRMWPFAAFAKIEAPAY